MKKNISKLNLKILITLIIICVFIAAIYIIKPFSKAEQADTSNKRQVITEVLNIQEAQIENVQRVYIGTPAKDTGEGTATSGSRENPVETLQEAYNILSQQGGIIVFLENKSINNWPSVNANKPAVIMGDTGAEVINITGTQLSFAGNIAFLSINMSCSYSAGTNATFYCNGHTAIFGAKGENNFKITRSANNIYFPTILGAGQDGTTVSSTNVKIYSGSYNQVFSGGGITATVTGSANLLVDGGNKSSSNITFSLNSSTYSQYVINSGNIPFGTTSTSASVGETRTNIKNITINSSVSGANGNIKSDTYLNIENASVTRISGICNSTTIGGNVYFDFNNLTSTTGLQHDCSSLFTGNDKLEYNLEISNSNLATLSLNNNYIKPYNLSLTITDSQITNYNDSTNVANNRNITFTGVKITNPPTIYQSKGENSLTISKSGSSDSPFEMSEYVDGSNTITYPINFIANNSYIKLNSQILFNNATLQSTYVTLTDASIINVNGTYQGDVNSTLLLTPTSQVRFNSKVKGTTSVDINNSDLYGTIEATLANCENGEDSFVKATTQVFPDKTLHLDNSKVTTSITWRVYYDYIFSNANTVIYVDGDSGKDEYETSDENDNIGSISYPVQTLERAYSLLSDDCNTIVLAGNVYVGDTESTTLVELPELPNRITNKDEFMVTITSTDGINDSISRAALYFLSSGTATRSYQFNSNVKLDHVRIANDKSAIETNVPKGERYLYNGGYKIIMGEELICDMQTSITNASRSFRRFSLFVGPYGKSVNKVSIEMLGGQFSNVQVTGGNGGIIGDSSRTEYSKEEEPVVSLKVNGGAVSSFNAFNTGSTTIYGNVYFEIGGKEPNSEIKPTIHNSSSQFTWMLGNSTIYGNANLKLVNNYVNMDRFYVNLLNGTNITGDIDFVNPDDRTFSLYTNFELGTGSIDGTANITINKIQQGMLVKSGLKTSEKTNININFVDSVEFKNIDIQNNANLLGNIDIHFYGNLSLAGYQTNPYIYSPSVGTAGLHYHGQNVVIDKAEKFSIYANSSEDGTPTSLMIREAGNYGNVEVDNNSEVYFIGNTTNINGNVNLKQDGKLTVDGKTLNIQGNLTGSNGILSFNGTDPVKINGEITGTTYVQTTREQIQIYGKPDSQENVIQSQDSQKVQIESELTEENRIWNIKCLNKVELIYVKDDGNDLNSGENPENAVSSIGKAFSLVPVDGTIVVCGPLNITEWPGTACKNVTITSKVTNESDNSVIDYRDTSEAVVTFKNSARIGTGQNLGIHLYSDIWFKELAISIESNSYTLFYKGHNVVFGVEGDEDSIRNVNNNKFYIYGSSATGGDTDTNFTINDGNFSSINLGPRAGTSTNATFTLNGGSIDNINVGHYSTVRGKVTINVYGGKVNGEIKPANTSGSISGNCHINIKNEHPLEFSDTSKIFVGGQSADDTHYDLNIEGKSEEDPVKLATVYMGSHSGTNKYETIGNIKNAIIDKLYASGNGSGTTTYPITLTLEGSTTVKNLYAAPESTGSVASTINITIKDNTIIENFLKEVNGRRAEEVNVNYENYGSEENPRVITDTYEGVDSLIIANNSHIRIEQENDTLEYKEIKLESGGHCYLTKAYKLNGNYIGNTSKEGAGYLYVKDGTSFTISGNVQGYTIVRCLDKENYKSEEGITISSSKVEDADASNYFALDNGTMQYATTDSASIWQIRAASDSIDRNIVYVSQSGDDGTNGTKKVPVKTINGAYKKIENLYNMNYGLMTPEQKQTIDEDGYKIILLDNVPVTEGDTSISEHSIYKVTLTSDENQDGVLSEEGSIVFDSDEKNSIYFAGETLIENIKINSTLTNTRPIFAANGYNVTFGKGIEISAVQDKYPEIYGGKYSGDAVAQTNLTVESGKYSMIYGGGNSSAVNGNVNLILGSKEDNSGPNMVDIGSYNQSYTGVFGGGFNNSVNGNINLTIYGGKYYRITGAGKQSSATVNGEVDSKFIAGETERIYGGGESAIVNGNVTTIIRRN